jgi:hypothetical protein
MVTIVWNPRGCHLTNVLAKGRKFNDVCYLTEILSPLSEWHAYDAPNSDYKLIVHADNARPRTARLSVLFLKDNHMKPAQHIPYSPDITPSDFHLFGSVK